MAVSVNVTRIGENKLLIIKVVREFTGKSLLETKNAVDAVPCVFTREEIKNGSVSAFKKALRNAGATVL